MATKGSDAGKPAAEFDFDQMAEISGGDTEFEKQIAGEYVTQAAGLLEEIARGATSGDAEVVRRSGHTLKGSSRTVGAITVAGFAAQIEQLGASNDTAAAKAAVERARTALLATQQLLDDYFGSDAYRRAA